MRFLKEAFRDPRNTGAIAPSSKGLAALIAEEADLAVARTVVELGPGTGAFTGAILARVDNASAYVGIERNAAFVKRLRTRYPGAVFHEGDAEDIGAILAVNGHDSCDRVVSGIPWSNLPARKRASMLGEVAASLAPGGIFLTFAYYPLNHLPGGRAFRAMLGRHFAEVRRSEVVLGNLPPAFIYVCRK